MFRQPLLCQYRNLEMLHNAYMPFLHHGGLFIRFNEFISPESIHIRQNIDLNIELPEETLHVNAPIFMQSEVVWITPMGAKSNKIPGLGVMFVGEGSLLLKKNIETLLVTLLSGDKLTDTF